MTIQGTLEDFVDKNTAVIKKDDGSKVKLKFRKNHPFIYKGIKYRFETINRGKDRFDVNWFYPLDAHFELKDALLLFPMFNEDEIKNLLKLLNTDKISGLSRILEDDALYETVINFLGEEKAGMLLKCLSDIWSNRNYTELWAFFNSARVPFDMPEIIKIAEFFKRRAERNNMTVTELIKKHPWILMQIDDVFDSIKEAMDICDSLAKYLALSKNSESIIACATSIIYRYMQKGHAYIPLYVLQEMMRGYIGKINNGEIFNMLASKSKNNIVGSVVADIKSFKNEMMGSKPFKDKAYLTQSVYLSKVYFEEDFIAKKLALMLSCHPKNLPKSRIMENTAKWAQEKGINLDSEQISAIRSVFDNKVTVLLGGAGSGKTTTLKALIYGLKESGIPAPLLAPTGIAAQRLAAEFDDVQYYTIHRYSRIYQDDDIFVSDSIEGSPETMDEKVVIVDEMSMATVPTIAKLLSITSPDTRLVFSGDPMQLPPIGPGGVFNALINNNKINKIYLKTSYRQKDEIIENALNIRNGKEITSGEKTIIKEAKNWNEASQQTVNVIEELLGNGVDFKDIFILARDRTGTGLLNETIRKFLLPFAKEHFFVKGDYIITTRNDYDDSVIIRKRPLKQIRKYRLPRPTIFNGTRGIITAVADDYITVTMFLPGRTVDVNYSPTEIMWYLEHAFATTVHKAQGGQAKYVVFVDPTPSEITRAMLYTAFTRSTDRVYLIGGKLDEWNQPKENELQLSKLYWRLNSYIQNNASQPKVYCERKVSIIQ